ncbi:MAG: hypothetical protein L6Q47_10690 [Ignavibacteriaceae bacterium]|nr:hypothetical protein [Ignavibacteriaceae bacterium]
MLSLVDNIYLIYTACRGDPGRGVFRLRLSCFSAGGTGILRRNIGKNRKFSAPSRPAARESGKGKREKV